MVTRADAGWVLKRVRVKCERGGNRALRAMNAERMVQLDGVTV